MKSEFIGVVRMNNKALYDLTNAQKSIWLSEQMYYNTNFANISGTLLIKERVDFKLLVKAINIFVQKNESMRIKLIIVDGIPKQYIEEYKTFDIENKKVANDNELKELENEIVSRPFEIIESELFKFTIVQLSDGTGGFNAKLHHIISDAWSMSLLINQIMEYYTKLVYGEEIDLSINPSYVEYIETEKEYKKSEKYEKDKAFWEDNFEELPEFARMMPYEVKEESSDAQRMAFILDSKTSESINQYCRENNLKSIYGFLMAIYAFYLARVAGVNVK